MVIAAATALGVAVALAARMARVVVAGFLSVRSCRAERDAECCERRAPADRGPIHRDDNVAGLEAGAFSGGAGMYRTHQRAAGHVLDRRTEGSRPRGGGTQALD